MLGDPRNRDLFLPPLRHNDVFDFTIWMVNWQRVRGTLCFELTRRENGEVIAQGTQQVVYMDTKTGRPLNLPEEEIEKFRLNNPRVFPFERFSKVTAMKSRFVMQRQVESMDLDVYDHVNNATYFKYAEEAVAQDFASNGCSPAKLTEADQTIAIRRLHIQYSSIAECGERLNISTHPLAVYDTGGSRYVRMTRVDGTPAAECVIDWQLVDRKSSEARGLPDELRRRLQVLVRSILAGNILHNSFSLS